MGLIAVHGFGIGATGVIASISSPRSEFFPGSPETRKAHWPFYAATPIEAPARAQSPGPSVKNEGGPTCEQSFSTTLDLGGQILFREAECVVVIETGAAANLACPRRLDRPSES